MAIGAVLGPYNRPSNRQTPANPQTSPDFANRQVVSQALRAALRPSSPSAGLRSASSVCSLPLAAAGANAAGVLPVLGRLQVRVPEGPGAALPRAGRIDGAARGSSPSKKTQSPLGNSFRLLRAPTRRTYCVLELSTSMPTQCGQGGDLLVVDPHMARRSGAAIAALRAGESQPVVIPGQVGHGGIQGQQSGDRPRSILLPDRELDHPLAEFSALIFAAGLEVFDGQLQAIAAGRDRRRACTCG